MRTTCQLLAALTLILTVRGAEPAAPKPLDAQYLRDHAQTRGFMLGRPVKARPTPDGSAVLFLRSAPRTPKLSLFEFDVASGKTRALLTPEQLLKGAEEKLTPEEKARRERQRVSVGGFTDYQLDESGKQILLALSGRLYLVERATAAASELKTGAGTILDPKFSPDGKQVAYVKDHDLFVYDLATDQETRLTTGGSEQKTHGLAEFVAQEEMDRHAGYWWSPDSKFIVYEEADAGGVEVWYVADPAKPDQPPHPSYYPRPGKKNVQVRVGIMPATGGETVWIDWDRKQFEYLTQVRWEAHGPLTLTVQNRLQNELAVLLGDPRTGKSQQIVMDKDDVWLNLHQDVPRWLADGKTFVWATDGGGNKHLELQFRELWPKGIAQAKETHFKNVGEFEELLSLDPKTGQYLYLRPGSKANSEKASDFDPTQSKVYLSTPMTRGLVRRRALLEKTGLGDGPGLQSATAARNHSAFAVTFATPKAMPETAVVKPDDEKNPKVTEALSKVIGKLPSVAESPGFIPQVEFTKVGDAPGFYAAVVRPHGFDPKKKYPVVLYVYGGPGHQVVLQSMRNWLLPQWIADQGFIVIALDNRGTPNRGRDWERAVYKKFGTVPLDDQVAGLQALGKKYPELDLERVGVYGWSFGGYLSALAVLKRPDVFHAAVAGAPVTDWEDYDTHYTERYLGLPQENPEAYQEASLLTYAKDLKRPLLLIHGTADDNVYFRHSLKLADALFRAGKDFEILPLPSLTHMVPDPVVMERLYGRIAGHFRKHLGTPK
ncbi:MAG: S9 family peptidase [Planctomycetia bacterium]|nr:S9 family peptidase [Planctomycetia bacterium]